MPVGTAGSVGSNAAAINKEVKAQIILGNTYHLYFGPVWR
jgi:queuine tRNA-ribosyltransferase